MLSFKGLLFFDKVLELFIIVDDRVAEKLIVHNIVATDYRAYVLLLLREQVLVHFAGRVIMG